MTTATDLERPPRYLHVPDHVGSYGPEVTDYAAAAGLDLDLEQQLLPQIAYAYDASGRLVSTEVGCAAPRQNVKTHAAKAMALADLGLFKVPDCLWTAHLRATSDDAFRNASGTGMADLFDNYDHLRRLVAPSGITDSDGEKSITLLAPRAGAPKPTLSFVTRGTGSGRGLTGRRVTFDEALFVKPNMVSAMLPILSAQSMSGQVQVRYLGSAGLLLSQVWREVRDRGRRGDERGLAWLEWIADREPCETDSCTHAVGIEGCALDRPHLIRQANLAVDRRMDIRFVTQTERRGMTALDFMTERLGWWQDPANTTGGDLDVAKWATLVDDSPRLRPLVLGVDVGEDRTASIAAVWRRADQLVQVELVADGLSPMATPARLLELHATWGATVVLGGPASALERDLPGVRVHVATSAEFSAACGAFEDLVKNGSVRHTNDDPLTDAVAAVQWRSVGTAGERAWKLKNTLGIGPLAAATRALHGLLDLQLAPPPAPQGLASSPTDRSEVVLSHIEF